MVSGRRRLGEPWELLELELRDPLERPERPDAERAGAAAGARAGPSPELLLPPEALRRFLSFIPAAVPPLDCWAAPVSLQRSADCLSERSLSGMGDGVILPALLSLRRERG